MNMDTHSISATNKWPSQSVSMQTLKLSLIFMIIVTVDIVSTNSMRGLANRPIDQCENSGPDDRSTDGELDNSLVIDSLVVFRTITPGTRADGSFIGMGIALNKKYLYVDERVRQVSLRETRKLIGQDTETYYPMAYQKPITSVIDTNDKKIDLFNMYTELVVTFGSTSIIKLAEGFNHGATNLVGYPRGLIAKDCVLYTWTDRPRGLMGPPKQGFKYFASHNVTRVFKNCLLEDYCDFYLENADLVCSFFSDYGAPIFCQGRLSYILVDTWKRSMTCTRQFKAINLWAHYARIDDALRAQTRNLTRQH